MGSQIQGNAAGFTRSSFNLAECELSTSQDSQTLQQIAAALKASNAPDHRGSPYEPVIDATQAQQLSQSTRGQIAKALTDAGADALAGSRPSPMEHHRVKVDALPSQSANHLAVTRGGLRLAQNPVVACADRAWSVSAPLGLRRADLMGRAC